MFLNCMSISWKIWNVRTDVKIGIFPIPIVYWLGLRIFKQNIGMVGQSVSMVMHWILEINLQSCSSRNVFWHRPGLNVGYSWPVVFLWGAIIIVLCKRNESKICWNQWILATFDDQIAKFCFRQKSRRNFSAFIVLMWAKFRKQGDVKSKRNFVAWWNFVPAGWNFVSLKRSFASMKQNFVSAKQIIVFIKRN